MHTRDLINEFKNVFGDTAGVKAYFAPGRVNLIGEHIDYNGGHVFPCALTIGTYAVARKRNDNIVRMFSMNFEQSGIVTTELSKLYQKEEGNWTNYPKGIIYTLCQGGYSIENGMDILFYGTIPNGSGLSSSASIEVLTGYICMDLFGLDYDMVDLALICQHSENHYNSVNCGIMDQFAIAMGKKKKAVFLETDSLKYQYVDLDLAGIKIVIMNTNKKRGLGDSKYNERRSECEEALRQIKTKCDIKNLCQLTEETWQEASALLSDEVIKKRAKHAVFENIRTLQAVEALKSEDIELFGKLMNESHHSLRDDYEVTGEELDTLVEAAWKQEGVLGARMTGAGFGGCAVALVKKAAVEEFTKNVGAIYEKQIGYPADFYVVDVGDGPKIL